MDDSKLQRTNLAKTYNDLPYTSKVFSYCQPTRLYTLAKMKGLEPTPLENATVLEIGCSFGGNLLPYAIRYPHSQLVGIDLSEHQINVGKQMMQSVGVENIELVAADISQVSFNIKFDYIICHGVFSWISESVRQAILQKIQEYLAPNGLAYVSYNTYPGWKVKEIAKDLMIFGSNMSLPTLGRIEQSIETLKFTGNILERENKDFPGALSGVFKDIGVSPKYYIAHEYFEDYNNPLYFKTFIQEITQHHLAYVTDSTKPMIFNKFIFKDDEYEKVCHFFNHSLENIEQYIDFIENRQFRTSVITHRANLEQHNITNNIESYSYCYHFHDLYLHTNVTFFEKTDGKGAYWKTLSNIEFGSTPLRDKLFSYLQSKNEPCKVSSIFDEMSKFPEYDETEIIHILFIIVHSQNTYLCFEAENHISYQEKPRIIEKYRNFIKFVMNNPEITYLSNKYYQPIIMDLFPSYLAQYLDGTRTVDQLTKQIRQDIKDGYLTLSKNEQNIEVNDISDKDLKQLISNSLNVLDSYGYFNHYSQ